MKAFDGLLRAMALLAGVILLALMAFTVVDVIARYFFNSPFRGSLEGTEFAMAMIVFLGVAYCGWTGGHIAVDLFEGLFARPSMRFVPALMSFIGGVLFTVIAWRAVIETMDAWTQVSNMLRMPHWPFRLTVAFGSAMFAAVLFVQAVQRIRGVKPNHEAH
jgi:TRAP-type transport system small permease protein